MSYQVFARKYRPNCFKDVLGQDHVVQTLCNAIEQKRLAHAYLFVGPRGTGKTSTARIFAKALNCTHGPRVDFDPQEDVCREIAEGRSLDVLEIDGASNRGIDNIRDLRDNVQFAPTRGQFRIIYIDEVHMLTKESFNALLKTLEEPPAHVKFIFATTEPHKILPTILSRCQRFDLRPIPADVIAKHLVFIAQEEGVSLSVEAAMGIARVADGGMRDAQSMLDQLVSFCGDTIEERDVNEIFGVTSSDTVAQILCYILDRQLPSLLHIVHELAEAGRDMGQLLAEVMGAVRELLVSKVAPNQSNASIPARWKESLDALLTRTPADKLIRVMEVLALTEERLRWSTNKRLHLEMGFVQAVHGLSEANISDIIRALNGAPIPEAPIASTVLPPIPYPSSAETTAVAAPAPAPVATPTPTPAPAPAPVAQPTPAAAPAIEAEPAPQVIIKQKAGLEPIDDEVPSFTPAAVPAPAPAPTPIPSPEPSPEPAAAEPAPEPKPEPEPLFDTPIDLGPAIPAYPPLTAQEMSPALWEECLAGIRASYPIKALSIVHCNFFNDDEGLITLGIHPDDSYGRDALLDESIIDAIKQFGQNRCGRDLRLRIITDDSLPAPASDEKILAPDPLPQERPAAPPAIKKENSPQASKSEESLQAEQKQREEEFYNDPLIALALEKFHARIIKGN